MSSLLSLRLSRVVFALAALCVPALGAHGYTMLVACFAVYYVYESMSAPKLISMCVLAVSIELLYGYPVGILSIATLTTAALYAIASRFILMTSWAPQRGWHFGDAVRACAQAFVWYAVFVLSSVAVLVLVYHEGVFTRSLMTIATSSSGVALMTIAVGLTIVRRIDVPFRPRIQFGT